MNSRELREKKGRAITSARAILDAAAAETRDATAEELTRFDAFMAEADGIDEQVARAERLEDQERRSAAIVNADPATRPVVNPPAGEQRGGSRATPEYRAAFGRFLRSGMNVLREDELRAMQADIDTLGGYLVAPMQMVNELIRDLDNAVIIRSLARVFQLDRAESLGAPVLTTRMDDADWTSELATGDLDTGIAFGRRELHPHPLAKRVKVSNKLLRQASLDPEQIVRSELAYKFGVAQENGFMTGSGANQPLGVFTASAQGISTGRDVTVGSTTAITGDGLIDVKHTLKAGYWPNATWVLHRDGLKQVRKLKDGNGQYIWQGGLQSDLPNTILERPYRLSEYAPNTFTTGLYVAVFGDFREGYWIADALDMTVQRLVELYAETNQTGFIGRLETDGMPVKEEAFVRGALA